ncbi:GyrI-like domain-containing protein [Leuconostoc mesenteroides]|uniref:GyrI-like domain-containing protein n=1 Tax=Leuconostoc mesenteroides TaxID=1245 RepID=UPI00235EC044|nr:GyrI-like domain-containing protein [Leuconostoc mesenteroides]
MDIYYQATNKPELVLFPNKKYIGIDGNGTPGSDVFYYKKSLIMNFFNQLVSNLPSSQLKKYENIIEIFYWYNGKWNDGIEINNFYSGIDLKHLKYRISIQVPISTTDEQISSTKSKLAEMAYIDYIDLFDYQAKLSVQILHQGPFGDEYKSLDKLQGFADEQALRREGVHQEIHLTNFEKYQDQTNLKTILRTEVIQTPITKNLEFTISRFIHFLNLGNTKTFANFFSENAIIEDSSIGKTFESKPQLIDYVDTYFKNYHTKTKIMKAQLIDEHKVTIHAHFSGDFGDEDGIMEISLDSDNLISHMYANLV